MHKIKLFTTYFFLQICVLQAQSEPGFLHANGTTIVNNKGNYLLKSINLGNYMLQEGYMLNLGSAYQHIVMQKIADLVGTAQRNEFYNAYYNNYITKADIDSISKWGFNSIRLPMHYQLFTTLGKAQSFHEQGFALVDQLLQWCKEKNLYLILDLHAVPGGQNSGDICDYDKTKPSLWESEENRTQTILLWKEFARRYAKEEYIGGYDVINETNWELGNNEALAKLMKDITKAIRSVDQQHLIFVEGNRYANDFKGLTPKWDDNMAYSFHKYWNDVTPESIAWILKIREEQNVPIWCGEFGEKSNHWIAESVDLFAQHNIGWAIWPYKKMDSPRGISSFAAPSHWSQLAAYLKGEGPLIERALAESILNEMLENIKAPNCSINYGYLYALFHQNNTAQPHFPITLPGKIYALHYDEGKNGTAYCDSLYQTDEYGAAGGMGHEMWNAGQIARNDGVDLRYSESEKAILVAQTSNNEWLQYTVYVAQSDSFLVQIRTAGKAGKMSLSCDGSNLINCQAIPSTANAETWVDTNLKTIALSKGRHVLRVFTVNAGYDISYLNFTVAEKKGK